MENASIQKPIYLVNPDVVLREEDEDGGLLFNPDTNQVKVVNSTGLFIWKQFASANQPDAVAGGTLQVILKGPSRRDCE